MNLIASFVDSQLGKHLSNAPPLRSLMQPKPHVTEWVYAATLCSWLACEASWIHERTDRHLGSSVRTMAFEFVAPETGICFVPLWQACQSGKLILHMSTLDLRAAVEVVLPLASDMLSYTL
jgi:hypothetical protein